MVNKYLFESPADFNTTNVNSNVNIKTLFYFVVGFAQQMAIFIVVIEITIIMPRFLKQPSKTILTSFLHYNKQNDLLEFS